MKYQVIYYMFYTLNLGGTILFSSPSVTEMKLEMKLNSEWQLQIKLLFIDIYTGTKDWG